MRTIVVGVVLAVVLGGALQASAGEQRREDRIRQLTQKALQLRQQGKLDEATKVLAEADRIAAGGDPEAGAGKKSGTDAAVDPAKEFTAGLLAMSKGDLDRAAQHFQAVIRQDPQSFEAHNNLAVIYAEQGKNAQALTELQRVLELRPDYYRGRKNLAELYARLASEAFVEAAAAAPADERAALLDRARLLASSGGEAATPPESHAQAESKPTVPPAPIATPAVAAASPQAAPGAAAMAGQQPRQFLALGPAGAHGVVIAGDHLWLYEQKGDAVRLLVGFPIAAGSRLPSADTLYVASGSNGKLTLQAVAGQGPSLTLRAAGKSSTAVLLSEADLQRVSEAVEPYLTPILVTSSLDGVSSGQDASVREQLLAAFHAWSSAWDHKDLNAYIDSYISSYAPQGSHESWVQQRQRIFSLSGDVSVEHSAPAVVLLTGDGAVTLTQQRYRSALQISTGAKELSWESTPAGWRINGEQMLVEKVSSPE